MTVDIPEAPEAQTACPACGSEPTDESLLKHQLSAMGYVHDDQIFQCAEDDCDETWVHGVPIGSDDRFADDLRCENPACAHEFGRVHRVHAKYPGGDLAFQLDLKCPECYLFWTVRREPDAGERALVGWPDTTGDTDDAEPYGYTE